MTTTTLTETMVTQLDDVENPSRRRRRRRDRQQAGGRKSYGMFLVILPFIILAFLFSYFPLYGWIYSLYDYKPALGLSGSEFVGLQWFQMLVSSPTQVAQISQVMMNTLAISFLGIATSVLNSAYLADGDDAEFVARWFGIEASEVLAAVQFENSLAA